MSNVHRVWSTEEQRWIYPQDVADPPYHIVNVGTGEHCGPFSSYLDAMLAISINNDGGWCHGMILNKHEFNAHQEGLT